METAVQWLLERVEDVDLTPKMWEQIKLTALEKEKEQICNSYVEGLEGLYMGAEEYYNKTYNQNK